MMQFDLPIEDVRAADQIVFECVERWSDPVAWQTHLLQRTATLLGMKVGVFAEVDTLKPGDVPRILSLVEYGWGNRRERETFTDSEKLERPAPFCEAPLDVAMRERLVGRRAAAVTRADVVAIEAWEASETYRRYYRPVGLFESVRSAHRLPNGGFSIICFATGRQPVAGPRERQLLETIHNGTAASYHGRLARWQHISTLGLTPRQQDVLQHLLEGESEQIIAKRLDRSRATVNEHIQAIYRHFGVASRPQLMAYLLHRTPLPRSSTKPPGVIP